MFTQLDNNGRELVMIYVNQFFKKFILGGMFCNYLSSFIILMLFLWLFINFGYQSSIPQKNYGSKFNRRKFSRWALTM
jgi:fluoride ion exporter CrcB/FEX